jgi:hypothetical protein
MSLYSLRHANRSVKLAALLFLLVLGFAYGFAFLMVKTWSGLTPARVQATYVPAPGMDEMDMAGESPRRRSHWTWVRCRRCSTRSTLTFSSRTATFTS